MLGAQFTRSLVRAFGCRYWSQVDVGDTQVLCGGLPALNCITPDLVTR